jgi:hypothetical protein
MKLGTRHKLAVSEFDLDRISIDVKLEDRARYPGPVHQLRDLGAAEVDKLFKEADIYAEAHRQKRGGEIPHMIFGFEYRIKTSREEESRKKKLSPTLAATLVEPTPATLETPRSKWTVELAAI